MNDLLGDARKLKAADLPTRGPPRGRESRARPRASGRGLAAPRNRVHRDGAFTAPVPVDSRRQGLPEGHPRQGKRAGELDWTRANEIDFSKL
jgi:hypothetical protein